VIRKLITVLSVALLLGVTGAASASADSDSPQGGLGINLLSDADIQSMSYNNGG